MTARWQIGYKGLIALARRSNTIKTIAAEPIHENDYFEVQLGMGRNLSHKIDIMKERGEVIGYYCLVELCNGGSQFKVMSKKDIENHRNKFSKAYDSTDPNNIWNKNFDAMALKTVVIQALKLCPISIEAMDAVAREEKEDIKDDISVDYTIADDVVDAEATVKPAADSQTENLPEPPKEQPKAEPVQESLGGLTPEEMAQADAAFNSAPSNVGDIF